MDRQSSSRQRLLPLHFEVPGHFIPLETFVCTAESAAAIAHHINEKFFAGKLELEIIVIPPEAGTFLTKLAVKVTSVRSLALVAILSGPLGDFGTGVFEEAIGQHPSEIGKQLVVAVRDSISAITTSAASEVQCEATAAAMALAVMWVLETENSVIAEASLDVSLAEALLEKRKFYEACQNLPDLMGVGFDLTADFPIRWADFGKHTSVPPADKPDAWEASIEQIMVTSPNWNRLDRGRKWKAKDKDGKARFFTIRDERFWELVTTDKLKTHVNDSLLVQWLYQKTANGPASITVLRVLRYNETLLSSPMTEKEILTIVDSFTVKPDLQLSLF